MLSGGWKTMRKCTPEGGKSHRGVVQNGFLEPFGGLLCARWAPFGRQGRSEAELGRLLGRSWSAPGVSWGRLGIALAGPGASWAAPGPPGDLFLEVCWACFGGSRAETPTSTKPRKTRVFCCILRGFKPPGALRTCSKTLPEGPQGGSWDPRPVWRAHVEVPGAQVGLHEAKLGYPGRFGTPC